MYSSQATTRSRPSWLVILFVVFLISGKTYAEGTPNLRTADGDPVLLFVGEDEFGDFASYDGPASGRLNFRIGSAGEVVYFGMARLYKNSGVPENFGQYKFRVRRASDGAVVFGPITVNANTENLTTYEQAEIGPDALAIGGYPVGDDFTFVPFEAGEYFVEFDQTTSGRARYIGLWDITIANNGVAQTGRVYSKNWAFRVPELSPELPDCAFGAELSTVFYSYTSDGFVTQIDFRNSGFQPLSFNLAFNRTGPGTTGNLLLDRMSIPENNATAGAAEHLIFLSEPDVMLFPDGECGSVSLNGNFQCQGADGFCIPITSTLTGQVEVLLDFNDNRQFDEGIDRILLYAFNDSTGLTACVPWDGLRGDGQVPSPGSTVDILVEYTQGLQHWALYDGELMTNGFCVNPVRPICGNGGNSDLYYDDGNIPDAPGTGAPLTELNGCDCTAPACRTWTNFDPDADDNCTINNDNTTGYGDRNTLNTWWFASSVSVASFDVPVELAGLTAPTEVCAGEATVLQLEYYGGNTITEVVWTGLNGVIPTSPGQQDITVTETGVYTATVTDEYDCQTTVEHVLVDVACMLNVNVLSVECQDGGTLTNPTDDTFIARVRVDGSNSSSYRYNGMLQSYGEEIVIGPFFITDGDIVFTARDSAFACCEESIAIPAPMGCSTGCAITVANITGTDCDDNGTPTDPSDDQFTFTMIIDGNNLGGSWKNDRGETGPYGEPLTFGPFPVADGAQNYQFTDCEDDNCVIVSTVQAPMTCSDACGFVPTVSNIRCDEAGTPFDSSDDTYTFDLSVEGINTSSPVYSVDGNGAYLYTQTNTFGPFVTQGDDYTFLIADLAGENCAFSFTLEDTPQTCSNACGMDIADYRVVCEDQGTTNAADDVLYVEVMVSAQNPGATGWYTVDGTEGSFGEFTRVATIPAGGVAMTVTVTEAGNAGCSASATVISPTISVSCPEDTARITHLVNVQSFRDTLSEGSDFTAGDQAVCWMAEEAYDSPRRYRERYTLRRAATDTVPGLRLFSLYLSAPQNVSLLGAVFSLMGEEQLDCCNLTNDGPVDAQPTNARSLPDLPDSLYPAGYALQQRFSVALRPGETYSLVTSSPMPGTTGAYEWLIVSADGEALLIDRANGPAPVQETQQIPAVFDLLTVEIADVLNVFNSPDRLGAPVVDSLCGTAAIAFNDSLLRTCDRALLLRSFDVAALDTTFTAACAQEISFRATGLQDITWPEQQLQFGCGDTFPALPSGFPDPAYSGYPFIYRAGIPVALDTSVQDSLRISYTDESELLDDGVRVVTRTWTITDICRAEITYYQQFLKLEGGGEPFFTCPISNHYCPVVEEDIMLWQVGDFDCGANVLVPAPELNNVCDTTGWLFTTEVLAVQTNGDTLLLLTLTAEDDRLLENLAPGDYLLRYTGTHAQETIEDRYCRFRVVDLTAPVAVCKSDLNLSVPGFGQVLVTTQVVSQGSYDNCEVVLEEVRRRLPDGHPDADSLGWSAWASGVIFDCEDVGFTWEIQYRLRDAAGNTNFCASTVVITDNTNPYCTGLTEQFITCDSLFDGFSAFDTTDLRRQFGMPVVIDNCSAFAIELSPEVVGDDCAPEFIRRRFNAADQHGNLSTGLFYQDIHIAPSLAYAIGFPVDVVTDCTDLTDTLRLTGTGCDSLTVTYTDIALPTEGDECRYFQRTFTVTNWCEWDGVSPAIVVGRDEDCDAVNGEETVWLVRTNDGIFTDGDSLITNNFPAENVRGALCGSENPQGYFREVTGVAGGRYTYNQRIKIVDTIAPELVLTLPDTICVDTSLCRTPVTVGIAVQDACQVADGQLLVSVDFDDDGVIDATSATQGTFAGAFPDYTYTITLPVGDHRFVFDVTDDCGNSRRTEQRFRVNDCYVPELICRGDRIYELEAVLEPGDIDGDGVVEEAAVLVEAVDLARCNFTDCSGNLTFSVNRVGERADRDQHTLFLDCEDRYLVALELYVWDDAYNPFSVQPDSTIGGFNWRRCVVEVFVQDPDLVCNNCTVDDALTIGGAVQTQSGTPMANVTIFNGAGAQTVSGVAGDYEIGGDVDSSYVLHATYDGVPGEGLSTIDVLMLRYHLLGLQEITNPYQLLIADVNQDGEISSMDVVALQALVLGREEFYPAGGTWRFIAADWDGTGVPAATIQLPALTDCTRGQDFTGLKLGDLNNTLGAAAGAMGGMVSGVARSQPLPLSVADASFKAGELVTVSAVLPPGDQYAGGQLALQWDPRTLVLTDYSGEQLNGRNVNVLTAEIRMSLPERITAPELITLTFRARAAGQLSDYLSLADIREFASEVYTNEIMSQSLTLVWTEAARPSDGGEEPSFAEQASETELNVHPNPVRDVLRVTLAANVSQPTILRVTDVAGREVYRTKIILTNGDATVEIDANDWPAGSYIVSTVGGIMKTRKMVIRQ